MTHENFKDVFIEVIKTTYRGPKYRKVKVAWWNLGYTNNPWPLQIHQTIKIKNEDRANWKYFDLSQPETHPGRRTT